MEYKLICFTCAYCGEEYGELLDKCEVCEYENAMYVKEYPIKDRIYKKLMKEKALTK